MGVSINQPTGIITFLFTDVEGSSRLWDTSRDAMEGALRQHDAIMRATLAERGGYVFTTAGDSFSAAFTDPIHAVMAAIDIQRSLRSAEWGLVGELKVRIGLHTGVADERDGDYFGPALNRTARVMDAGHGGQILISLSTEEVVRRHLPAEVSLLDQGVHHLKDLGDSEHLFQVRHPDLAADFPPLRLVEMRPNNLPHLVSSFIGREAELADLSAKLEESRLITLTGVGGSGKTRLAIQVAAMDLEHYRDGAWLVELAPIDQPEMGVGAISAALGVPISSYQGLDLPGSTGLDALADHIRSWNALVILDNCEHLIAMSATVAAALLQRCPDLKIMATSREGLGIPGETLWQVGSLSLPVRGGEILDSECVQLFLARAEASGVPAAPLSHELAAIADICIRLDGLPLAVELAAARSNLLTPTEIARRLDDRFRLLTGGARTALPRHQTLEATVAWSFDLLHEMEQIAFRRLAVFQGGFTLGSAEDVVAFDPVDEIQVIDLLSNLVARSMVARDSKTGRFAMLETLRQYGLQKLVAADESEPVRRRHLALFVSIARDMQLAMLSPRETDARGWFTAELPNIRSAITFGVDNGAVPAAVELLNAAAWFLQASGNDDILADAGKQALVHAPALEARAASLLYAYTASGLAALGEVEEAIALARHSREIAADVEDPAAKAEACFAEYVATEGSAPAERLRALIEKTIGYAKRYHPYWLGTAYVVLSVAARDSDDIARAEQAAALGEAAFREAGAPSGIAWALWMAGTVQRLKGDYAAELRSQKEALQIYEELGDSPGALLSRQAIALSLSYLERHDEAVRVADELRARAPQRASSRDNYANHRRMARIHRRAGLTQRLCTDAAEILRIARSELTGPFHRTLAIESVLLDVHTGSDDRLARLVGWYEQSAAAIDRSVPRAEAHRMGALRARLEESLGNRYTELNTEGESLTSEEALAVAESLLVERCGALDAG